MRLFLKIFLHSNVQWLSRNTNCCCTPVFNFLFFKIFFLFFCITNLIWRVWCNWTLSIFILFSHFRLYYSLYEAIFILHCKNYWSFLLYSFSYSVFVIISFNFISFTTARWLCAPAIFLVGKQSLIKLAKIQVWRYIIEHLLKVCKFLFELSDIVIHFLLATWFCSSFLVLFEFFLLKFRCFGIAFKYWV